MSPHKLMACFLLWSGFSFWLPEGPTRIGMITTGLYLFGMVYSPGEGPVPFTYSAEAYPLYLRAIGMSFATATTWGFNSLLAMTWPPMAAAMTPTGAFAFYSACNLVGWSLVLLFMPETKGRTLEELDEVFGVPLASRVAYGRAQAAWFIRRYVLRQDVEKPEVPLASGAGVLGTEMRRWSSSGSSIPQDPLV